MFLLVEGNPKTTFPTLDHFNSWNKGQFFMQYCLKVCYYSAFYLPVNTTGAGLAELEVTATGPQGQGLAVEALPPSEGEGGQAGEGGHSVQLLPNTPGHYRIYCSYGGQKTRINPFSIFAKYVCFFLLWWLVF